MPARSTRWSRGRIAAVVAILLGAMALGPGLWPIAELYATPVSIDPVANIAWDGDSQSADVGFGSQTTPEHTEALFAEEVYVRNQARGGSTTVQLVDRDYRIDEMFTYLPAVLNVVVAWIGTNDLGLGDEPADVIDRLRTYCEERRDRGWKVVVATALPRTFVTDVPGYEERRLAFNELLRAEWRSFADALADVGADPTIGVQGAQNDPTYFEPSDRSHLLDPGKAIVATQIHDAITSLGVG